jgi:RNA polymerase sigma-70 factor (ECF subfamily)
MVNPTGTGSVSCRASSVGIDVEQWPLTQKSLLDRIHDPSDDQAWCRFVDTYGPFLYQYARRQGLQDADAADVTQDILRRVSSAMEDFQYDPGKGSFRGWLFTIARNSLRNFLAAAARRERGTGDTHCRQLLEQQPVEAHDSRVWDEEYQRHLLSLAADQIRDLFAANTWQAFWQTAVDGKEVKDVAQSLGMSVGAVYVARSRVLARLRQEIQLLEPDHHS